MQLIAGNWKMNGLLSARNEVAQLVAELKSKPRQAEVLICPPATLLRALQPLTFGTAVQLGGQNCHAKESGAHTGDISAEMLKDAGATYVIAGHSERRTDHKETNAEVAAQAMAAWRAKINVIVCVGESEQQRMSGQMREVIGRQIEESVPRQAETAHLSIAYEPIWAIGTGKTASLNDITEAHDFIHEILNRHLGAPAKDLRVLYGGSVKPSNAREILALKPVGGVLVGGASLKAADFGAIIDGARGAQTP